MSADTTPGLEAERAAFEAWALSEGWTPSKLDRGRCTTYAWAALNDAWEVWQAARRAPAPAQGPTDAEIDALLDTPANLAWYISDDKRSRMRLYARAVLARWGAPAASGEPVAWMHEEDPRRVISDAQREGARRDGGASLTSVRAYTVPLVRRP